MTTNERILRIVGAGEVRIVPGEIPRRVDHVSLTFDLTPERLRAVALFRIVGESAPTACARICPTMCGKLADPRDGVDGMLALIMADLGIEE